MKKKNSLQKASLQSYPKIRPLADDPAALPSSHSPLLSFSHISRRPSSRDVSWRKPNDYFCFIACADNARNNVPQQRSHELTSSSVLLSRSCFQVLRRCSSSRHELAAQTPSPRHHSFTSL